MLPHLVISASSLVVVIALSSVPAAAGADAGMGAGTTATGEGTAGTGTTGMERELQGHVETEKALSRIQRSVPAAPQIVPSYRGAVDLQGSASTGSGQAVINSSDFASPIEGNSVLSVPPAA